MLKHLLLLSKLFLIRLVMIGIMTFHKIEGGVVFHIVHGYDLCGCP